MVLFSKWELVYFLIRMRIRNIYIILLSILCFTSCIDSTEFSDSLWKPSTEAKHLSISYSEARFGAEESLQKKMTVETTNVSWQFSGAASWLSISPQSGNVNTSVIANAEPNLSPTTSRTSVVVFESQDTDFPCSKNIIFNQDAAKYKISLSQNILEVPASASVQTVTISANAEWEYSISDNWIHAYVSDDKIYLSIEDNKTSLTSDRIGMVNFKCGSATASLTINQVPPSISTDTKEISVDEEGGTYQIQVNSDVSWTANASQTWINAYKESTNSNILIVTIASNHTASQREGNVYVRIGNQEMIKIPVKQTGLYLKTDKTSLRAGKEADVQYIEIDCNTEWRVISAPEFIRVTPETGSKGKYKIEVSISKNTGGDRSGTIVIGNSAVTNLTRSITVSQEGSMFEMTETSITIGSTGGKHEVTLSTNLQWTASSNVSWCHVSPASGNSSQRLLIEFDDNPSVEKRTGEVVVIPVGSEFQPIKILVNQNGRYLTVNAEKLEFTSKGGQYDISIETDSRTFSAQTPTWASVSANPSIPFHFIVSVGPYYGDEPRTDEIIFFLTGLNEGETCERKITIVQKGPIQTIGKEDFGEEQDWNLGGETNATITITWFGIDNDWNFK